VRYERGAAQATRAQQCRERMCRLVARPVRRCCAKCRYRAEKANGPPGASLINIQSHNAGRSGVSHSPNHTCGTKKLDRSDPDHR